MIAINASSSASKNTFACGKIAEPLGIGASQIPAIFNLTVSLYWSITSLNSHTYMHAHMEYVYNRIK